MSEPLDAALARALSARGALPPEVLEAALAEAGARRAAGAEASLALTLLARGLVAPPLLADALREAARSSEPTGELVPTAAAASGARLGRYVLVRELARGGMGAVWEALDPATGARYALKTLLPGAGSEARLRLGREAELLARLDHPHVVRVHAADLTGEAPYLVQDLLPGGTLADRLRQGGPLGPRAALELALSLTQALRHAHRHGVLHRDVKPANVLFDDRGEPRLADFGVARLEGASLRLTASGDVVGTPNCMAPEQARGEPAGERADAYGLGALLFAALTGEPPFPGAQVLAVLHAVVHAPAPRVRERRAAAAASTEDVALLAALDELVHELLAKDPAARPDLASVEGRLLSLRRGAPSVRPRRRLARALALAGLTLALGLGALAIGTRRGRATAELARIEAALEREAIPALAGATPREAAADLAAALAARERALTGLRGLAAAGEARRARALALAQAARRVLAAEGARDLAPATTRRHAATLVADAVALAAAGEERQARERLARALTLEPGFSPARLLEVELLEPAALGAWAERAALGLEGEARAWFERRLVRRASRELSELAEVSRPDAAQEACAALLAAARTLDPDAPARVGARALAACGPAWVHALEEAWARGREAALLGRLASIARAAAGATDPPAGLTLPALLRAALAARCAEALAEFGRLERERPGTRSAFELLGRMLELDRRLAYEVDPTWRLAPELIAELARAVTLVTVVREFPRVATLAALACLRCGSALTASQLALVVRPAELDWFSERHPRSRAARFARALYDEVAGEGRPTAEQLRLGRAIVDSVTHPGLGPDLAARYVAEGYSRAARRLDVVLVARAQEGALPEELEPLGREQIACCEAGLAAPELRQDKRGDLHYYVAAVHWRFGRHDQALAALRRGIDDVRTRTDRLEAGERAAQVGRLQRALANFTLLRLGPAEALPLIREARATLSAPGVVSSEVRVGRERALVLGTLCRALSGLGRAAEAWAEVAAEADAVVEHDPLAGLEVARAALAAGERARARELAAAIDHPDARRFAERLR